MEQADKLQELWDKYLNDLCLTDLNSIQIIVLIHENIITSDENYLTLCDGLAHHSPIFAPNIKIRNYGTLRFLIGS